MPNIAIIQNLLIVCIFLNNSCASLPADHGETEYFFVTTQVILTVVGWKLSLFAA